MKKKTKLIICTVALLAIFIGFIAWKMCTVWIEPGYVGIQYSVNGGIQGDTLGQGLNFKNPFTKVTNYSVATTQGNLSKDKKEGSKDDDSFMIATSDGKTVEVDLEYSYHFDVDVLSETFTKFKGQDGEQIEKTFMRGKLKTYVSDVSSKFSVLDIYGEKRTDLNAAILEYAREKFAEFGIIIDSINLSRIELDTQTAEAIQKKINKQQELEELKLEAQKAEVEVEKLLVEKQAQADAEILKAQAEADAELIKAQAQAEANRLISESLTSELLQLEKIQKWSGEVPMVQGDSTPILDLK